MGRCFYCTLNKLILVGFSYEYHGLVCRLLVWTCKLSVADTAEKVVKHQKQSLTAQSPHYIYNIYVNTCTPESWTYKINVSQW